MKKIYRILDDLSPSDMKLRNLPRKPNGLYNMHFNEYGQIVKRAGYSAYNTLLEDEGVHGILGMHRYYKQDLTKEFIIAWNTKQYVVSDTDPWGTTTLKDGSFVIGAATYEGDGGLDDATSGGYFTGNEPITYRVQTDTDAEPDTFKWSIDDGETWKEEKVEIKGEAQELSKGVTILFTATEGHTLGDYWTIVITLDSSDKTFTEDKQTYFVDFLNHCYSVNGEDGMFKYGGITIRKVGITVPDAPTLNTLMDGELGEGNYQFRITYVDENGYESNGSTALTVAVEAHDNDGVVLNIPVSADDKVVYRNIYRTALNGEIFYYDGQVADNETETFNSIQADDELGTILSEINTAPPSTPHLITKRRNKLYLADSDYLYPSYTGDIEYFPALWAIRTGNSQKITGLLEQLTALPVFTNDSVERLVGTDEDNFEFRNSYSTEGNIALRSLVNCDNFLVYLGFNGINYFDGVSSGIFSQALNEYIKTNIVKAYAYLSCATYWNNKYILCYPKTGGTYPTETVWYDLKTKTYGVYSYAFSCFAKWDRGNDGLRLFSGSNTKGQVYELTGTNDNGSAITCYDNPEPIDLGMPDIWKQWYNVYIKVKTPANSTTALKLYYTLDDNDETCQSKTMTREDITFVSGGDEADTITTEAGDFVAAGFVDGDVLVVTDTDSNDGDMAIVSVAAKTITLGTGVVTAEAEGKATLTTYLTLTADTTKWYKVDLGGGGQRARSLKPRPYVSNKYDVTFMGYAFVFDTEAPEY